VVEADLIMAIGRRGTSGLQKPTEGEVKSERSSKYPALHFSPQWFGCLVRKSL